MAEGNDPVAVAGSAASALKSLDELRNQLDSLLEKYLHLLDQYDIAQKQLASFMSLGFFSLAQANFKNSSRTRYGQDYYDDRMQAVRRVSISPDNDKENESTVKVTVHKKAIRATTEADENEKDVAEKQQPTPPASPTESKVPPKLPKQDTASPKDSETSIQPKDPLKWFGILVPQSLRSAQASFASAMDSPASDAVNASRGMRQVEIEIRKLRKDIRKAERANKDMNDGN